MTDLAFQSATDLVNAIKSRKIQSTELLELYIERMQCYNPKINAIVAVDLENARECALASDEALDKGENWGVLHGLPVTIKDSFEVVGMPCTSGSPELKDYRPAQNAFVVQKLLDAGAIIFGKTNLPLFAMDFQSYNAVYGQTNNPWNLYMVPGGSSGGAAAALAAGLTGLEMGSDIGGSIRNPAHFCGVFGHKPTFGIVPFIGHIPPPPGTYSGEYTTDFDIAVAGPLARSAKDQTSWVLRQVARLDRREWRRPALGDDTAAYVAEVVLAAAFCSCFHARTLASEASSTTSATERCPSSA